MGVTKRELQDKFENEIEELESIFNSLNKNNKENATSHIFKKLKMIYELKALSVKYRNT